MLADSVKLFALGRKSSTGENLPNFFLSTVKYYGGFKSKKNIIFNKTNQKKKQKK